MSRYLHLPKRLVVAASISAGLLVLALATLVGQDKPADDPEEPAPQGEEKYIQAWEKPKHRLVSFWNIGPTRRDKDAPYREPYYMFGMKSWKEFIAKHIEPEYKWGCRRWILHNPFGDAPGPMHFDQFLLAKEHGFTHLTDDFVEAWTDFMKRHPDVEVSAYLGKLRDQKNFTVHLDNGEPHKWLERALKSVEPVLACGMGVGFDASSRAVKDGPVHSFMKMMQATGTKVYAEAWPNKGWEHLTEFGVATAERYYQTRKPKGVLIPAEKFKGEIVILVTGNLANNRALDKDPKALQALIDDIHKRGFTAAVPVRVLMGKQADS